MRKWFSCEKRSTGIGLLWERIFNQSPDSNKVKWIGEKIKKVKAFCVILLSLILLYTFTHFFVSRAGTIFVAFSLHCPMISAIYDSDCFVLERQQKLRKGRQFWKVLWLVVNLRGRLINSRVVLFCCWPLERLLSCPLSLLPQPEPVFLFILWYISGPSGR